MAAMPSSNYVKRITNQQLCYRHDGLYLRNWCATNKQDTISITDGKGKKLFQAALFDKDTHGKVDSTLKALAKDPTVSARIIERLKV